MLVLRGHAKSVRSLAFSPAGRVLASGAVDRTVRLWDLGTGQAQAVLKGPRTYVHAVTFSPDGEFLACAGGDLILWHLATGRSARSNKAQVQTVGDVAWAPDGRAIATASRLLGGGNTVLAGSVQLWDARWHVAALKDPVTLPRKGAALAMLPPEWDRTKAIEEHLRIGSRGGYHVWGVAFAPDSGTLALGTDSGGIFLWDLSGERSPVRLSMSTACQKLAFAADGRLLAATEASRMRVWDPTTGQAVCTLRGHGKRVTALAFAPGGGAERAPLLLTGSEDETVRFWDVLGGRERAAFSWPVGKVRAVAFAPEGMTAAAAGDKGDVVIWDVDEPG